MTNVRDIILKLMKLKLKLNIELGRKLCHYNNVFNVE
jgi:hypothetical protein